MKIKGIGYSLAAIKDAAQEADKVIVPRTTTEHLRERERHIARDIALCERRLRELGA